MKFNLYEINPRLGFRTLFAANVSWGYCITVVNSQELHAPTKPGEETTLVSMHDSRKRFVAIGRGSDIPTGHPDA